MSTSGGGACLLGRLGLVGMAESGSDELEGRVKQERFTTKITVDFTELTAPHESSAVHHDVTLVSLSLSPTAQA